MTVSNAQLAKQLRTVEAVLVDTRAELQRLQARVDALEGAREEVRPNE